MQIKFKSNLVQSEIKGLKASPLHDEGCVLWSLAILCKYDLRRSHYFFIK